MASSIVLVIKNSSTSSVGPSSAPHESVMRLTNLLQGAMGGDHNLSIDAYASSTAPAAASGTITLTYASIANNDTVTVGGVTLTCVTGTPTAGQFKKVTDGPTTATNLAAAINADATLGACLTASANSSVVTITSNEKGLAGNMVQYATSNGTGFALVQPTGGTGGATGTASTYRLGL